MPTFPVSPPVALHIVTGKGGTGKTTVAAALGLALAKGGARVLVVEVEGRGGLAAAFGVPQRQGEQLVATITGGGEVHVLDVDARAALLQYLRLKVPVPAAAGVLTAIGAVDFATTIAPGIRDVIVLGKVYEAARRHLTTRPGEHYDAVVLDAPPTGRVGRFLSAAAQVAAMAQVGPIRAQAERIDGWLRASTAIHLVTLLEELPVEETVESVAELTGLGWPVTQVVVNQHDPSTLPDEVVGALVDPDVVEALQAELRGCGLDVPAATAGHLVDELGARAARDEHRRALLARLTSTGLPARSLRPAAGETDREVLDDLADQLLTVEAPA